MRWLREYTAAAMQLINFFFTAALQISMRTKSPVENSGSFAAGGSATKGSPAAKSISLDPDDSAAEGGSTANNSSGGSATKGGPAAINSSVAAGGSAAKGHPVANSISVAAATWPISHIVHCHPGARWCMSVHRCIHRT